MSPANARRRTALARTCAAVCFSAAAVTLGSTFLAAAPGCAKDAPKPSAEPPIVVGVSLGLTKGFASFTAPLRDSIRSAEGEINAAGGLLGRRVEFDIVDDRSDEKDFVASVAQDFANRGVAAVIGPVGSGQVKATAKILAEQGIIQLAPAATSTELTNIQTTADRFLFRTTPADDFQGAAVILFATKTPRGLGDAGVAAVDGGSGAGTCNKLAIVYIDNPYGQSMTKVIVDNFPKRGKDKKVVAQKSIPVEATASYASIVGPIILAQPECLAIIAYEDPAAQFIADFKADQGYAALAANGFFFIGTDGVYTSGFLTKSRKDESDDTSETTAEGVFGTNPDTQPGSPEYNRFKTIYSSYFPLPPGTLDVPAFAANTFDSAILIAFAIQKAGTATDRAAIRDALKQVSSPPGRPISPSEITDGLIELRNGGDIDYKGASGNVDFQANGNVNGGMIIWQAVRDTATKKVNYKTVARFTTEELVEQVQ